MSDHFAVIRIVDAIREVTAEMQRALDSKERSANIDAHDLVEVLLAIADRLDPAEPEVPSTHQDLLSAARALLEAREDQMVTSEEWDRLRLAVEAASDG